MNCVQPITLRIKGALTTVNCGKCAFCLTKRSRDWSIRLREQLRIAKTAYFITLTYDEDNVFKLKWGHLDAKEEYEFNEAISLDDFASMNPKLGKNDLSIFIRELRRLTKKWVEDPRHDKIMSYLSNKPYLEGFKLNSIKFYGVGEYGETTKRPHWHIIIFNVPNIELAQKAWNKGFIKVGTVTDASIGYTLKYLVTDSPSIVRCSKHLGINYLERARYNINNSSSVNYRFDEGQKAPLPRYYKEKLFDKTTLKSINYGIQQTAIQKEDEKLQKWADQGFNPFEKQQEQKENLRLYITKQSKIKKL